MHTSNIEKGGGIQLKESGKRNLARRVGPAELGKKNWAKEAPPASNTTDAGSTLARAQAKGPRGVVPDSGMDDVRTWIDFPILG